MNTPLPLGQLVPDESPLIGRRDAFHVACVVGHWDPDDYPDWKPQPGERARRGTTSIS